MEHRCPIQINVPCHHNISSTDYNGGLTQDTLLKVLFVKIKIIAHLNKGTAGLSKDTENVDRFTP